MGNKNFKGILEIQKVLATYSQLVSLENLNPETDYCKGKGLKDHVIYTAASLLSQTGLSKNDLKAAMKQNMKLCMAESDGIFFSATEECIKQHPINEQDKQLVKDVINFSKEPSKMRNKLMKYRRK